MKLQIRSSRFGNPILGSAEVIGAIRQLVQAACHHDDLMPVDKDGLRLECADCGHQSQSVAIDLYVRAAR